MISAIMSAIARASQVNLPGIYHATGHNGCKIPLFKTLMTNKCKNDCKYCINQSKRNFTRLELSPEELSRAFALLQQRLCQWSFFKFRNWRYYRQHYGKDHRDCKNP